MVQATANFAAFIDGDSYRGRQNSDTPDIPILTQAKAEYAKVQ